MTPMERMLIESRAKSSGRSMSSYMVQCAMGKDIKLITDEEKKAYINLANYHTNFNRISSLIREGAPIYDELQTVIREIREQLNILKNGK